MSSPPSLLDMPEMVMNMILEESDLKSIINLRKVCQNLRDFIDSSDSGPQLLDLNIYIEPEKIEAWYYSTDGLNVVEYRKYMGKINGEGLVITYNSEHQNFEKTNFLDVFLQDLKFFVSRQKSVLRQIRVQRGNLLDFFDDEALKKVYIRVFEEFKNILESRPRPLSTKEFHVAVDNSDGVLLLLEHFDSEKMENLSIYSILKEKNEVLDISEIKKTDHWRNAGILNIEGFILDVPVLEFSQFSFVRVAMKSISAEDLIELKEILILSPESSREFIFTYNELNSDSQLKELLGEPFVTNDIFGRSQIKWTIEYPDNIKDLIVMHSPNERKIKITNIESFEDYVNRLRRERS